jgi:CheY-like chemotaxis protein
MEDAAGPAAVAEATPSPVPGEATGEQPSGRRRRIAPQPDEPAAPQPVTPQPAAEPRSATPDLRQEQHEPQPAAQQQHQPEPSYPQPQPEPQDQPQPQNEPQNEPQPADAEQAEAGAAAEEEAAAEQPVEHTVVAASPILNGSRPQPERPRQSQPALPMPGSARSPDPRTSGVSVQTLGQGIPVAQLTQLAEQRNAAGSTASRGVPVPGSHAGRRRKLAAPPAEDPRVGGSGHPASAAGTAHPAGAAHPANPDTPPRGRQFAIGAPAEGSEEGPEPLDGPNGAVEVTDGRGLRLSEPADAELPPEPLDNPRRLLVWPEPDVSTQQALTERGYRPVLVQSRQEVDAQIAAYPAALFVDPLTGPITRTALQSLRQAAVAAGVPVLVTAGLGQASRDAAYGADPAVLLKALAPRDSEQHPPRVLLVEERQPIADALSMALERRGMQVAHAATDSDAMEIAAQFRPNLVVMDLGQVRRRRAGIIDWLRVNDLLSHTPFVVYTAADLDPSGLPRLASGETVLFLAERSTSPEVQDRIVDLLTKIGAGPLPS